MGGSKMSRQTIKDRLNRTLGYIEDMGGGKQKAYDSMNRTLGFFDPRTNKTTDALNRTLSNGNVLSGLIYDKR